MSGRIGIVIVNWNAGVRLAQCIESIDSIEDCARLFETIVVVDNASGDGSADLTLRTTVPLTVIRNSVNKGFAAACNQGAQLLSSQYLLFLNPDTRLSEKGVLRTLGAMDRGRDRGVGIVGLQLLDDKGAVTRTCCRLPSAGRLLWELSGLDRLLIRWPLGYRMREFDHLSTREVGHVIGACFLVRKEVFDDLGGFDERFFLYFEDLDFSWRARRAGWRSWFVAEESAYHQGGGCSKQIPARRLFYSWASRILFTRKHFGRCTSALVVLGTVIVEPLLRLVVGALTLSFPTVRATLSACRLTLKSLPTIAQGRCPQYEQIGRRHPRLSDLAPR